MPLPVPMKIKNIDFTAGWEGLRLKVYLDVVGIPTIGYGHVLLPGESFPNGITKVEAVELLRKDMSKAEKAINDWVNVPLTQNQFDALCSLVFNIGTGRPKYDGGFWSSTVRRKLNGSDYQGAADAFLMWCKAGGTVNTGLLNRRKAERLLFMKPDEQPSVKTEDPAPPAHQPISSYLPNLPDSKKTSFSFLSFFKNIYIYYKNK